MKLMPSRRSSQIGYSKGIVQASDVFEQTEKSLISEAFGRPLGIGAILVLVLAIATFSANSLLWTVDKVSDYALVAFFVSGGILLSLLLRSGEPKAVPTKPKPKRYQLEEREPEDGEMVLGHREPAPEPIAEDLGDQRRGLAEESPAGAPIPAGATAQTLHTVDVEQDDEVAGYEQALLHYADRGDLHGQGEVLRRLGHVAKTRDHLSESREFYVNARNCFKETGDFYAEAAVLLDLGQVLESLNEQDAAAAAYRDANRALLDVAMNNSGSRGGSAYAQAAD